MKAFGQPGHIKEYVLSVVAADFKDNRGQSPDLAERTQQDNV